MQNLGHVGKIFMLAWNPFYSDVLASSSDDFTIRIWNIKNVFSIIDKFK